jgi:putative membrane protein
MTAQLPYCGSPPVPGELLTRFNLDPILLAALLTLAVLHLLHLRRRHGVGPRGSLACASVGWLIAGAALVSPLCALSVALFAARVGQHMILVLAAAALIAYAWPPHQSSLARAAKYGGWRMWGPATAFFVALWFWHMPDPYDATFRSTLVYWSMHVTLFGSGILLWRVLLHHPPGQATEVLAVGALTSMHMSLLGAVLTFAGRPLFAWHLLSMTGRWSLTPLQDQQLGGVFMWVPGMLLFLWVAVRSLGRLWNALEGVKTA